jgi:hypothetical protein
MHTSARAHTCMHSNPPLPTAGTHKHVYNATHTRHARMHTHKARRSVYGKERSLPATTHARKPPIRPFQDHSLCVPSSVSKWKAPCTTQKTMSTITFGCWSPFHCLSQVRIFIVIPTLLLSKVVRLSPAHRSSPWPTSTKRVLRIASEQVPFRALLVKAQQSTSVTVPDVSHVQVWITTRWLSIGERL